MMGKNMCLNLVSSPTHHTLVQYSVRLETLDGSERIYHTVVLLDTHTYISAERKLVICEMPLITKHFTH